MGKTVNMRLTHCRISVFFARLTVRAALSEYATRLIVSVNSDHKILLIVSKILVYAFSASHGGIWIWIFYVSIIPSLWPFVMPSYTLAKAFRRPNIQNYGDTHGSDRGFGFRASQNPTFGPCSFRWRISSRNLCPCTYNTEYSGAHDQPSNKRQGWQLNTASIYRP